MKKLVLLTLLASILLVNCGGTTSSPAGNGGSEESDGDFLGSYQLTYYMIAFEDDYSGEKDTNLYAANGSVVATTTNAFAEEVSMEGTGYLSDGSLINEYSECGLGEFGICFVKISDPECEFGYGSEDNCLRPFRTVAADYSILSYGTKLYIPAFVGLTMPGENGFVHDGCVTVEDTGVSGEHIDFFAEKMDYYETIDHALDEITEVEIFINSTKCQ
jgi:3D (Asp-Asp-Asp) domain-containing protein